MYAVVRIAGKQFAIRPQQRLRVPRLEAEVGAEVALDDVLLVSADASHQVGSPRVPGGRVTARVLGHDRDRKVLVFRKKRRKDSKKRNGHRQPYTEIQIQEIQVS
ncbi:MAG: 50S ribosomal protein L21 [Candidatus Krumholzibacteriia bacterium]